MQQWRWMQATRGMMAAKAPTLPFWADAASLSHAAENLRFGVL